MHRPRLRVTAAVAAAAAAVCATVPGLLDGGAARACRAEEPIVQAPVLPAKAGDAEAAAAAESARLEAHLKAVATKLGTMRTLTASFTQRKYLEVFKEEVVSAGTLALADSSRLRWEFTSPVKSVLIVNGERGRRERTSRRGVKTSSVFALASDPVAAATAEQVFLWMQGSFEKARRSYDLKLEPLEPAEPVAVAPAATPGEEKPADKPAAKETRPAKVPVIVATPRDERMAKVIACVRLRFADDLGALAEVVLEERGGARTVITFTDVRRDVKLDESLFGIADE